MRIGDAGQVQPLVGPQQELDVDRVRSAKSAGRDSVTSGSASSSCSSHLRVSRAAAAAPSASAKRKCLSGGVSVFPVTSGLGWPAFASARACPVTVLGRRGSRTTSVRPSAGSGNPSCPPTTAAEADLWISPRAILAFDGARGRPGRYDRGPVAATLTTSSPPLRSPERGGTGKDPRLLRVAWRYEPDLFPISWNADGVVVESFAPDFYLPEIDIYLELTTLNGPLVRKKNRKLRWPDSSTRRSA